MNGDRVRPIRLSVIGMPRTLIHFFLVVLLLGACQRSDPKAKARQLLSEIDQIAESSRSEFRTEETKAALTRLNELGPSFPERRDEIAKEAQTVKALFSRSAGKDRKMIELWQKLLSLPLSHDFAKCVEVQVQVQKLIIARSESMVEEMDALTDDSITDHE